ncbi:uncharacterized protein LOC6554034 isoform X5 [Drosophila erecta]|uniref:uncharacterized protein LOC6554034 isoform X5 n=1 Tax=Drosophila erecta TaxID=7220 RepID=UPI000F063403|nr:uncharacterized protein LOC6554034 isoform X5 [Drosophila erecta]
MKATKNGGQLLIAPSPQTAARLLPLRTYSNASSLGHHHDRSTLSDGDEEEGGLGYTHTLMYGRYTKDLGEFAKDEARKLKILEKRRKQEDKQRNKCWEIFTGTAGQTLDPGEAGVIMDLEAHGGPAGRGLGLPGAAGHHYGHALVHHGQGHIHMYKRANLAVSRSDVTAFCSVHRMGLTAGLFDIVLGRLCPSHRTAEYRFWYTRNEDHTARRSIERVSHI